MQTDTAAWYSPSLGQVMELKAYGDGGRPVLVFPTSGKSCPFSKAGTPGVAGLP